MPDHFCDEVFVTSVDGLYGSACSPLWLKLLKVSMWMSNYLHL